MPGPLCHSVEVQECGGLVRQLGAAASWGMEDTPEAEIHYVSHR